MASRANVVVPKRTIESAICVEGSHEIEKRIETLKWKKYLKDRSEKEREGHRERNKRYKGQRERNKGERCIWEMERGIRGEGER